MPNRGDAIKMLELNGVDAGYGELRILHDINISLAEKEFVSLVGPNGAGKTTTLRTIAGLLEPMAGEINFNGENINENSPKEISRKGLSFVTEEGNLFRGMTVKENLMMGAYTIKDKKQKQKNLEFVLSLFPRLGERQSQLSGTLSGGERKMLSIARGLMSNPSLLLVDEPSLGLAPQLVTVVFDSLTKLNEEEDVTILLVEQNVNTALKITDRAYVLEQGEIVLEGPSEELKEKDHVKDAYLGVVKE